MTENLSILQGLLSRLPMSLWSAVVRHQQALMPEPMTFMICVSLRSYSTLPVSHIMYLMCAARVTC